MKVPDIKEIKGKYCLAGFFEFFGFGVKWKARFIKDEEFKPAQYVLDRRNVGIKITTFPQYELAPSDNRIEELQRVATTQAETMAKTHKWK